ncbi:hypothetical protein BZL29_7707 [Mycobacterium kansasii]|uniref:Uncharacterized protein n=1 Tax=Mycobacterium kansasii TaxID=1768 RepID=A0A1V3WFS2_MYCKA|nr:hypothetical protein BZL29_7707 [Mycobacterium kansasii]
MDLAVFGPRLAAAGVDEGYRPEIYSVCGQRCNHIATRLGPFSYANRWLSWRRCERCGWVVALSRGTLEQEITHYLPDGAQREVITAAGGDPDLLRRIFVAILADAPPGRAGEPGHRSDLLAHAARHRPVVIVCQDCSESSSAAVAHGQGALCCPDSAVICAECTFCAGVWAGEREGMTAGECVVSAPCSVLITLAHHYGADFAASSDTAPRVRITDATRLAGSRARQWCT